MTNELLKAAEDMLAGIIDYVEYKHDGDPWAEDARAMGEMELNEMDNDGRLDSYRAIVKKAKKAS